MLGLVGGPLAVASATTTLFSLYEQVSVCGADEVEMNAFWVQNKTIVRLSRMGDLGSSGLENVKPVNLKDYADGVWRVVNGMGLSPSET